VQKNSPRMRLLHTSTYKVHEFFGNEIPNYAILSHRWEEEEVSLYDLENEKGFEKAGFAKISGCCARSVLDGFQYVWIDTCCIDKTSSAELSEAINSMYLWYQNAQVCYAYLSDAVKGGRPEEHFSRSKWFKRGWTLQELLAPSFVAFYDRFWNEIGTKFSLVTEIESITGIRSLAQIDQACVAEKMSWASRRETTRVEDMAYCLMGLFDVHMAPLYGEGPKAFIRLQLEILSKSDDESIFAWADVLGHQGGLLASSPKAFQHSGNIQLLNFDKERPQYSMTNKGLRIELVLIQSDDSSAGSAPTEYLAPLNCGDRGIKLSPNHKTETAAEVIRPANNRRRGWRWSRDDFSQRINRRQIAKRDAIYPIVIRLRQLHLNQYVRVHSGKIESWVPPKAFRTAAGLKQSFVRQIIYSQQPSGPELNKRMFTPDPSVFLVKTATIFGHGYRISESLYSCSKCTCWNISKIEESTLIIRESVICSLHGKHYGALMFSKEDSVSFAVVLEVDNHKSAGADLLIPYKDKPLKDTIANFYLMRTQSRRMLRLDRASKVTQHGSSVSLALRCTGRREYMVDISLSETEGPVSSPQVFMKDHAEDIEDLEIHKEVKGREGLERLDRLRRIGTGPGGLRSTVPRKQVKQWKWQPRLLTQLNTC
jgi:hypothetical protein